VVVMVVVVMVMSSGKSGGAGKHHQEQNCGENLFHGRHPSRIELATEASCRTPVSKEQREYQQRSGVRRSAFDLPISISIRFSAF
jgi:hypothetical protein